jgi:hypothetical protein
MPSGKSDMRLVRGICLSLKQGLEGVFRAKTEISL